MTKEIYSIRVKGYLDQERSSWFDGLTITYTTGGETILSGSIADQAALHGILAKIRDLGLSLLEVKRGGTAESMFQRQRLRPRQLPTTYSPPPANPTPSSSTTRVGDPDDAPVREVDRALSAGEPPLLQQRVAVVPRHPRVRSLRRHRAGAS